MSRSFARITNDMDGTAKEYMWAANLSKETDTVNWNFEDEDDDTDYLEHTLFLRNAVLGKGAKEGERNIVEAVTKDPNGKEVVCTFLALTLGKTEMCTLDLNFNHVVPVKFRLVEGSGPVHLTGQHFLEFPEDPDADQTEDELEECTEDTEATATEGTETEEDTSTKKGSKRKNSTQNGGKQKQKGKLDSSNMSTGDDDEDEEEDDEENDESMDDDEEMDSEEEDSAEEESPAPRKKKAPAKTKAPKSPKGAVKANKGSAKKAGKKNRK